ncbi:MAG: DUF808 domain-containing protein [Sphingobacteriia bacterium]|nr:DUF808 domain-containing protein [Sphingobacteriia bacterium]NCC40988.1 DUF808 domain-containing protein [Gammaproteobacteria bacterium]
MATGLLAVLDDIATLLDDVALLTKVAARKTAGVLGDDLALNAEQVSGVRAERELPVVFAVFKGSLVNKLILVPAALLISTLAPWAVLPLLTIGGLFLCYEGAEKLLHWRRPGQGEGAEQAHAALTAALLDPHADLARLEHDKIKGAIRTDFILSAEIVVITLGSVAATPLATQIMVVTAIALLMTFGVYGLVALIVKLDDIGLWLTRRPDPGVLWDALRRLGEWLLGLSPRLMRALSVLGMLAMFLVGGGILTHAIPALHHPIAILHEQPVIGALLPLLLDAAIGVIAGLLLVWMSALRRPRPA